MAYAVAVLSVAAAVAARMALDPVLGDRQPFAAFYLAVTIAAWFGGLGPALLALGLGWLCADFFFMPPRCAFGVTPPADVVLPVIYAMVGLTVAAPLARRAKALRDSEARMRAIITSAADAIITVDAGHKITLFNAGAEAIFGHSADEMIGQTLDQLIPERFREVHHRHITAFGATA